mgnify:CR=1 FL=1
MAAREGAAVKGRLWAGLRSARYALPGLAGRLLPAPGPAEAAQLCARLWQRGLRTSAGYFQPADAPAEAIVAAYRDLAARLREAGCDSYLSVKAPAFGFDPAALAAIAAAGLDVVLDAHAEPQAAATLAMAAAQPGIGAVLPARWRRSLGDAEALRDAPVRLRIVKGEWADPAGDLADIDGAYRALVRVLAGRAAPVAIATHDPLLAEAALTMLKAAGTPCELEQLRGLPRRRTSALAARLGVPVRLYCPFGPGWWPYAIDKALARPYLPLWAVKDWLA